MGTAVSICWEKLLHLRILLLCVVLFSVDGWSVCGWRTTIDSYSFNGQCGNKSTVYAGYCGSASMNYCCNNSEGSFTYSLTINGQCYSSTEPYIVDVESRKSTCVNGNGWSSYIDYRLFICTTKCEADSVKCLRNGMVWDSQNCDCYDVCENLESQCLQAGGRFEGRAIKVNGQTCCSAVCDRCNTEANDKIVELKRKYCCDAGFAPPEEGQNCYAPQDDFSKCGVTTKQRLPNNLAYKCRDPNSSQEAAESFYENCFGSSSSGEGGGSSSSGEGGGGSSSGEGGGSSSGGNTTYPEGCDECPWLDSILDTLTLLKFNTDDILQCIVNPGLCSTTPEEEGTQVDSVILEGVKERLDSVVAGLHNNASFLKILDSLGKSMRMDSLKKRLDSVFALASLKNDTSTRRVIAGFESSVDENLLKLRQVTDTNFVKLRNGIFELDTGMKHHLDSIVAHLPDTIFDSIRKYQDSTLDRIDTALFGAGVGFSLVDSMIDTVVKYFRVSNHYDSVYNSMFASFDSTFKYKMENLEMSIETDYSALGYGDTATSTLRSDLSDFKNSVSDGFESLKSSLGYGDTATNTLRGDLSDFKNSVLGAIASFDSSVSSEISDLLGVFSPGAVDSGSVGYGSGFIAEGERYSDSLARAIGWLGGLDGVNVDSVFSHSTWETSGVDSVNDFVNDTLGGILDSLHLRLKSENDSIKGSLTDSLTVWADSLIKVSPFVSFDSLIYSTIGARIPNSDQCPEDCQSWSLTLPRFGLINYTVDFGLCLGRLPLGGLNVLGFLRLIIRLVIVWSCISIVMWTFSHRKM